MKRRITYVFLLLSSLAACRKEQQVLPNNAAAASKTDSLTLDRVKQFYSKQTASSNLTAESTGQSFSLSKLAVPWNNARSFANKSGNYWLVPLSGAPIFQKTKQGYRKLAFLRDADGTIQARILEFIPDGLYFQRKRKVTTADYTGRIFIYDQAYHLLGGELRANGKLAGQIRPSAHASGTSSLVRTDSMAVTEDCEWYDNNYINSDGMLVVYSERICTLSISGSDGTGDGFDGGSGNYAGSGDGGNGDSAGTPPASNLPGELGPAINPKSLMDCFGNVPSAGAAMKVTVYVQEPFPGTSFNIGPNSVGHVAIGLTKTNGNNSVTQIVGYYPNASGLDKIHAPSKVVNNGGDLEYNVSISYTVSAGQFNQITSYISNPPTHYDLTDFNCTNFVYNACEAGGVTLPDPFSTVGLLPVTAMTPAGLGNSIEKLKGQNNVNTTGGITPNSKGPCN
ncbi:hypothetical protein [Mucilaginibacter sp.]|uniref:hypothetical protein n=1 Tax=Mucilaginibacter sp. TaxID=1882438 RepID=UPI00261AFF07|nr:hypothetical protein [Mucilaginibacter sp.]MDB4921833.1 hypothetical protein [Mucilaginibacter sp.]